MTASHRKDWAVLAAALLIAGLALLPPVKAGAGLALDHGVGAFQARYFDSQSVRFLCL